MTASTVGVVAVLFSSGLQQPAVGQPWSVQHGYPFFGSIVAGVGDVDADGIPDLAIADPGSEFSRDIPGTVWIVSITSGQVLHVVRGSSPSEGFGRPIAGAGDVDADGHADWIVGAPGWDDESPGHVVAYSGASGVALHRWEGDRPGAELGSSVGGAGDVDGDGHADLIVAYWGESSPIHVVRSGKDGTVLTEARPEQSDLVGQCVDGLGVISAAIVLDDVDGDDVPDLAVANAEYGVAQGRVFALSGSDHGVIWSSEPTPGWHAGHSIDAVGDMDDDGIADLIVGTWHGLAREPGQAYVHSGKDGSLLFVFAREGDTVVRRNRDRR